MIQLKVVDERKRMRLEDCRCVSDILQPLAGNTGTPAMRQMGRGDDDAGWLAPRKAGSPVIFASPAGSVYDLPAMRA
jgi:hypothetical protein